MSVLRIALLLLITTSAQAEFGCFRDGHLTLSPAVTATMALPIGPQAGWATVRIGDAYYVIPVYHFAQPITVPELGWKPTQDQPPNWLVR